MDEHPSKSPPAAHAGKTIVCGCQTRLCAVLALTMLMSDRQALELPLSHTHRIWIAYLITITYSQESSLSS